MFMSNHNHCEDSNFRLKDCIIRAEDIVNRAIQLKYSGVSITDHESVSAHIRILQRYKEMKKLKEKYCQLLKDNKQEEINNDANIQKELILLQSMDLDFKLGLGNEIYLINDIEDVTTNYVPRETKFWHFILIAKNAKGYQQIRQISSESAWKNWFRHGKMERVPTVKNEIEDIIGKEKGNIIATTACLGGEFPQMVLSYLKNNDMNIKRQIHDFLTWGINIFGKENFFIELQPTILKENEDGKLQETEQSIFNKFAITIANAYGIHYTIATDSHYLKKEDRTIHASYLNADGDNSSNRELGDFYETAYMMSIEELIDILSSHLTEAQILNGLKNTMRIHQMIEDYDLQHDVIVPRDKQIPPFEVCGIFKEWYNNCQYIEKFANSTDIQERYFLYKCELGFLDKKQDFNKENILRIDIEMKEIWESSNKINMRIAPYYILVENLINKIMWEISYVGIARGSVTGFYTAYLMDITQMNPIKYKLPHWRHLSSERPELPKQYWAFDVNPIAQGCAA